MRNNHRTTIVMLSICLLLYAVPDFALAAEKAFKSIQPIPGIEVGSELTTAGYIQVLYNLAIGAAALLVLFKLISAGVQYMFSELVTSKQKAKSDIMNALLGLLIILSAVLLLNTINPNLTKLDLLRSADPVQIGLSGGTPKSNSASNFKPGSSIAYSELKGDWPLYTAYADGCKNNGGNISTDTSAVGWGESIYAPQAAAEKTIIRCVSK